MSEHLISLLPSYAAPATILVCQKVAGHANVIERQPIDYMLNQLQRKTWIEGLFTTKKDFDQIKRYQNRDGSYKSDFDEKQFLTWVKTIESSMAIAEMENKALGKGVFVLPKAIIPKGTFIPSSGIIKLHLTREDFETKNHCSVLQDVSSPGREIYGLIDPGETGGLLDLINHGPEEDEIDNFKFKPVSVKGNVALANLKGTIKFYNGYAIMGVEAFQDIDGGEYGKQLLWSYAQPDEYLLPPRDGVVHPTLYLFDNRSHDHGEIIDLRHYQFKKVSIFLDTGEAVLRKVALLTRWELMQAAPESDLVITLEDPYSSIQSDAITSSIPHAILQSYLKQNPAADRVIMSVPVVKEARKEPVRKDRT